ncbi:hypothetical protein [Corynebacterium sp. H113]|uniref:hypothetical protein n=1 Tax=Corynebacterium sp. H113 TaxID=3133419 RepID=UPI0030A82339
MGTRHEYETYIAPEDPFISTEEFLALNMIERGEALFHLVKRNEYDYAEKLLDSCSQGEGIAAIVSANNYAKRFFPPLNPQVDPLPEGVKDVTPDKPVAHIAFAPRPKRSKR